MEERSGFILVVDDNEMNRDMLARRLERHNHRVELAEDGQKALAMMRENDFDLVLLDVQMPRMTGYEVLETVKRDPKLRHVPVIMISAVDDLDSVVKCVEMGAEDYLFKPFNPVLLRARISATLDKKRTSGAAVISALRPIMEVIQNEASITVSGKYGALNEAQTAALGRILEHTREAEQILGNFGTWS